MRLKASLLCLCLVTLSAWAEEPQHDHPASNDVPSSQHIHHIEVTLPKSLLPDFTVYDQAFSMNEAVQLGLQYNLGLQVADTEVGIQKAFLKDAKAQRWPVLSVGSLTFLRAGNSQTLMTPDMMMNTVDSTLFQDFNATGRIPIFTGGRIRGGIRAMQSALEGGEANLRNEVIETAFQIKEAYLAALLSQTEHLVHQQHLKVQEILLKNTEAKYRVGKGLRADVLRIQTEIADAQKMLNDEHIKLNNKLYDLKATMGIDLGSEITLSDKLIYQDWNKPDLDILVKTAVQDHPRFLEAQKQLEEAKAQLKVAQSEYYPQVYGQVTGNLRIPDRPPMMGNGVIGMMTASLPVFDKGRSAKVAIAQANLKKAEQSMKEIQLEVAKEVAKAWSELQFAQDNISLAKPAVAQAEEDFRLTERRFNVGRAIVVEVQDAALQFRQAQLNEAEAVYSYEIAKAKVLKAVGQVSN